MGPLPVLFASDLDRTLIFSTKFTLPPTSVCVEYKDGRPISYMLEKSLDRLQSIKPCLVPITTRSLEQFKRVTPFQDCTWAITSNGAVILHEGCIYQPWQDLVKNTLKTVDFDTILDTLHLKEVFASHNLPYNPRLIDNAFYYFTISTQSKLAIEYHLQTILPDTWHFTIQGLKLYILPKLITKESALSYLKTILKPKTVITAGDGKLDVNFLSLGNLILSPIHSEAQKALTKPHETVSGTIHGGFEILQKVSDYIHAQT